jgi:hypothetical protein
VVVYFVATGFSNIACVTRKRCTARDLKCLVGPLGNGSIVMALNADLLSRDD